MLVQTQRELFSRRTQNGFVLKAHSEDISKETKGKNLSEQHSLLKALTIANSCLQKVAEEIPKSVYEVQYPQEEEKVGRNQEALE